MLACGRVQSADAIVVARGQQLYVNVMGVRLGLFEVYDSRRLTLEEYLTCVLQGFCFFLSFSLLYYFCLFSFFYCHPSRRVCDDDLTRQHVLYDITL